MDEDDEVILGYGDECQKAHVRMELRELQLHAYASLVDAVRASGKLDEVKRNFMIDVRKYFDISDERHQMECKRASLDPHLNRIAECLTGIDFKNTWRLEGTPTFPEPPMFRRLCTNLEEMCANKIKISLPVCKEGDEGITETKRKSKRGAAAAAAAELKRKKVIKDGKSQVPRTKNNNNITPKAPPSSTPPPPLPSSSSPMLPVPVVAESAANANDNFILNPTTGEMELLLLPESLKDEDSNSNATTIAISMSSDSATEVTVVGATDDKNISKISSNPLPVVSTITTVKSEVLETEDETKILKEEDEKVVIKSNEPNRSEGGGGTAINNNNSESQPDLKIKIEEEPTNSTSVGIGNLGISPFLLSLFQQPRSNNKNSRPLLDERMSLLNLMSSSANRNPNVVHHEAENGQLFGMAERRWAELDYRREQGVQTSPVSFAPEEDEDCSSSEGEDEFFGYGYGYGYHRAVRERSPDITDTPTSTPIKQRLASLKGSAAAKAKAKGAKRKMSTTTTKRPIKLEIPSAASTKKTKTSTSRSVKNTKQPKAPKPPKQPAKPKISNNSKSKGKAAAAADPGGPVLPEEVDVKDVQMIKIEQSTVTDNAAAAIADPTVPSPAPVVAGAAAAAATPPVGRGRGVSKAKGGAGGRGGAGGTGRSRGVPRGKGTNSNATPGPSGNNHEIPGVNCNTPLSTMSPLEQFPHMMANATIKIEPPSPTKSSVTAAAARFPSQSKSTSHHHHTTKSVRPTKPKKSKPVSCSRRKSSLKAKEDDEMQVTWDDHDYEGAVLVRGNSLIPIRKRRSVSSNETSVNSGDEHNRRKDRSYFNNDSPPEDLPHHQLQQQYWNRGVIKRRISTNTGDEDDPETQPFNDDETDSASENESERGDYPATPSPASSTTTSGASHNNNQPQSNVLIPQQQQQRAKNKSPSLSPPMQQQQQQHSSPSLLQKQQRVAVASSTTPLKINSNVLPGGTNSNNPNQIMTQSQLLPRITLPPPVFSTTLSNDTRAPKPVSVVESLNLHLPITPTASSLAASSAVIRRTPTIGIGGVVVGGAVTVSSTSSGVGVAGSSSSSSVGGVGVSSGGSGCGIFSNSQALIANSRGTPGILQKQRKAQPHILSNSKAHHQRTFIPTSNNNTTNNSSNPSQSQQQNAPTPTDSYNNPGEQTDFLILTLPNNL